MSCEEKEPEMQCAAICIAEHSYAYTTEMESYLLEAAVSTSYGSETVRFEYSGSDEEQYGESSGVIMMLTATGFWANAEHELNIDNLIFNGQAVDIEQTDYREKTECGGTCDAKSFSVVTDDISSLD